MSKRIEDSHWGKVVFATAVLLCALLVGKKAHAQTTVWTNSGYVTGYVTSSHRGFLGIPYAAPPTGNLRWKSPQAATPWAPFVRLATSLGAVCPQLNGANIVSANEDCLNLSVVTPLTGTNLPVMVFIHGGAFTTGANSYYDQSLLSNQGNTIVVTVNYRLGVFGFLAHSALTAESADQSSGQYGLQDQQFALTWVKNNIAYFGGNPNNVTVFGESAGGVSVCAQIASAKAAGLFNKAIIQSGLCSVAFKPLAEAESAGASFAGAIGCTTAACLRSKSTLTLLYNPPTESTAIGPGWNPTYGGVNSVVPVLPRDAIAAGNFNRVPVISGSTHDEWRLFTGITEITQGAALTTQQYYNDVLAHFGATVGNAALAQYPVANYSAANVAHATLMSDAIFVCGGRQTGAILSNYVTTYAYEFNDPNAPPLVASKYMPMLASHASELAYVFKTANTSLNASQKVLSDQIMKYWTNFAATGNPNGYGLPAWPAYSASNESFQRLAPGAIAPITNFAIDHKCAFWNSQNVY